MTLTRKLPEWLQGILIFFATLLLFSFLIFLILESSPALVRKLNLGKIHYFSLRERYTADPVLIFQTRSGYVYRGIFAGDLSTASSKLAIPYEARFDEEGFRNSGQSGPKAIAVIGDSFIQFGLDESDAFSARLEKVSGLSTANYGMEWYGPDQYLEVLKRYALKRHPKIALFCFFEGNDLRDILKYREWKDGGDYYHFNLTSKNIFQRYALALKDTLTYFIKPMLRKWDPRRVSIRLPGAESFDTVFTYELEKRSPEELANDFEIRHLKEVLEAFRAETNKTGAAPLVLFIPSSTHIFAPYASGLSREQIQTRDNMEKAVMKAADEVRIPYFSLTPLFEEKTAEGKILYYPADTHWNSEGRQTAAEAVAGELRRLSKAEIFPELPAPEPAPNHPR